MRLNTNGHWHVVECKILEYSCRASEFQELENVHQSILVCVSFCGCDELFRYAIKVYLYMQNLYCSELFSLIRNTNKQQHCDSSLRFRHTERRSMEAHASFGIYSDV